MIKTISITDGVPTNLPFLIGIVAVSMIKDAYEDIVRYRRDEQENQTETHVFNNNSDIEDATWAQVAVGDIVQVKEDEFIPADLVLLWTSELKGNCFIETKNLDGETNLKTK